MQEANDFKLWLDRKELTVADFASKTKLSYHTIAKWYNGTAHPRGACKLVIEQNFPDCPLLRQ